MQVEVSNKIIIDGTPKEFHYTLEDGKDQDFCEIVLKAQSKLHKKMQQYINQNCG